MFKPNLIPNNGGQGHSKHHEYIMKNGGYEKYFALLKKDGCRLELDGVVKTRAMKMPKSTLVVKRFSPLAQIAAREGLILEGEFYSHGMQFREVLRFFNNSDVTSEKELKKLQKMKFKKYNGDTEKWELHSKDQGSKSELEHEYPGKTIKWLTTFHYSLHFWLFDGIVKDQPDLGFEERMLIILERLSKYDLADLYCTTPLLMNIRDGQYLHILYEEALEEGFEGLVLIHRDHKYKMGRSTLSSGTLLKMKDDKNEFDGAILDVVEGTEVREGVERTKNELGRSVTSKCKGDRKQSGLAKGFLVKFADGEFIVGLRGFDNEAKRELLENKENYIGRDFIYTGMPPAKDYPRHAYFSEWRDEK